ncbi:excalibur calcium-binding domain-containing protein [Desulfogranum marinum]|uniref:excalibur calcium-binding domain-containing protein n=1 Tax=Desulfogranum marinum TaxID=453220 RepID=UPI00196374B4|nr:excalibur calcium-binding domain-containing protein [Desulfogranum marinum]MBM9514705.1 excalibur calcium-binding domain-containing protein [Desulfogranum marinum]
MTQQINQAHDATTKAQLLVFRARKYVEKRSYSAAITDYIQAIRLTDAGWIWNELGQLCYRIKKYEDAYKISKALQEKYPEFSKIGAQLAEKSLAKINQKLLKENPPEIVYTTPGVGSDAYEVRRRHRYEHRFGSQGSSNSSTSEENNAKDIDRAGKRLRCDDLTSVEAEEYFRQGGHDYLDRDNDGIPCENSGW